MSNLNNVSTWDDLTIQVARLIKENEQLKKDKQELTNKLVNLELKMKQAEQRKKQTYSGLISEGKQTDRSGECR